MSKKFVYINYALFALCFICMFFMGAKNSARTVEAEKFIFKDDKGRSRLVIQNTENGPTLFINDVNGKSGLTLVITDQGSFKSILPEVKTK